MLRSFFKTLVNHEVTVELKNDISIRGTLKSVDQYLNIKLDDIMVLDDIKYPHLVCLVHLHRDGGAGHETQRRMTRHADSQTQFHANQG